MEEALAEARAREAPWLQLIALAALCERADATSEDRAAMRRLQDELAAARGERPQ
jgi:hypothetical protein